jgi:hypothetical protein
MEKWLANILEKLLGKVLGKQDWGGGGGSSRVSIDKNYLLFCTKISFLFIANAEEDHQCVQSLLLIKNYKSRSNL